MLHAGGTLARRVGQHPWSWAWEAAAVRLWSTISSRRGQHHGAGAHWPHRRQASKPRAVPGPQHEATRPSMFFGVTSSRLRRRAQLPSAGAYHEPSANESRQPTAMG
ncbi:uncharacterized protein BKA78DRAFT_306179 [Phyllosticta capitalensis]|uniref:uncharacterized protein n=1 Tax=Phyllosticta capitalensis TaxID=121624 RepID=UPI00312E5C4E